MNILMLTESNFPIDIRVRLEAYKLIENGHGISVIAIKDNDQTYYEVIEGVNVYRVPKIEIFKHGKQSKSSSSSFIDRLLMLMKAIAGYSFEYLYFTIACFFLSLLVLKKDKFDVIHTHNPPDTLFLIAGFYKLFGKKFIYDHHDLCPELFLEKYGSENIALYKILLLLEQVSCKLADRVIATNESYKKIEIERSGVNPGDVYVVRYGPDLNEMKITNPIQEIQSRAKTILCYLGAINIQDGVDYLLITLSRLINEHSLKDILLLIIGDGDYLNSIKIMAKKMDLMDHIIFAGFIDNRDKLNNHLSTADIFVDTAPYSFLNDNSTFIKHMEYMIFEKPVVSFALKESMLSLKDAGVFVPCNDTNKMAESIIELINNNPIRDQLGINAAVRVKQLSWDKVSMPLIQAYKSIE